MSSNKSELEKLVHNNHEMKEQALIENNNEEKKEQAQKADADNEEEKEPTQIADTDLSLMRFLKPLQLKKNESWYLEKFANYKKHPIDSLKKLSEFKRIQEGVISSDDLSRMGIDTKELTLLKAVNEIDSKTAWLSAETTIEEINVNQQYFKVEGWLTTFWRDEKFHDKLISFKCGDTSPTKWFTQFLKYYEKDTIIAKCDGDYKKVFQKKVRTEINNTTNEKYKTVRRRLQTYIDLTDHIAGMQKEYKMPFDLLTGHNRSSQDIDFNLFSNVIEFGLVGNNAVALEYNLEEATFKLHIHFRATLYECFENNEGDFPFEWQFLNMQLLFRINRYHFVAKVPDFVERAFMFPNYWKHSEAIWRYAVLARKRGNVEEWSLLAPWVDLRHIAPRKRDYGYVFWFGLIKYRVKRKPNYYMLYIIIPLFLMIACAFAVLLPIWIEESISDRLSYLITLLLTVAAFQLAISDVLPYKSQFTLIDKYFLLGYFILAALVLEGSLAESFPNNAETLDIIFACVLGALWFGYSMEFVFKLISFQEASNRGFGAMCRGIGVMLKGLFCWGFWRAFGLCLGDYCCVNRRRDNRTERWMRMEKREASSWDHATKLSDKSISKKAELVLGTNGDMYALRNGDIKNGECYQEIDGTADPQYNDKSILQRRNKLVAMLKTNVEN